MKDTFAVKREKGFISPTLMSFPEEAKLEGFRGWDLLSAPLGSQGQSSWHTRLKQIGWMVTMNLLRAVERAEEMMENK